MHGLVDPQGYLCALFEAQESLCFHCNKPMIFVRGAGLPKGLMATREHLYPKGLNGRGMHHNVVLAHGDCNNKRGCQPPTEAELIKASALYAKIGLQAFISPEEYKTNKHLRMPEEIIEAHKQAKSKYTAPTLGDLWPK